MPGPEKPISQTDYSGGVNSVTNPFLVGPKQVGRLSNLVLDEHGSLRTIDGTHIFTTAPSSEQGSRLLLPLAWKPVGGGLQQLVIARPTSAASKLYSWATNPWTLIGSFVGNSQTPSYAVLSNLMAFTDGYNTPKSWDGATFQNLAGYPAGVGAQFIISHEGFLFCWNTKDTTDATDGPSALRQSDLNQPNSWNNAQIAFVGKDDGTQGRGMALYTIAEAGIAPQDTLILFKDVSTYQVTGNMGTGGGQPSSNFAIQQIKSDMGCSAPKSIQFCTGFGVVRLAHKGFALFNGIEDQLISEEIRPYIFGKDDITPINWQIVDTCWSAQSHNPPWYICICPTATVTVSPVVYPNFYLWCKNFADTTVVPLVGQNITLQAFVTSDPTGTTAAIFSAADVGKIINAWGGAIRLTYFPGPGGSDYTIQGVVMSALVQLYTVTPSTHIANPSQWSISTTTYGAFSSTIGQQLGQSGPTVSTAAGSRAFIYDLIRRAWTIVDFPFGVASAALLTGSGFLPTFVLCDAPDISTAPSMRRWLSQDPDWDGIAVSWLVRSRTAYDGSPMQPFYWRRVHFDILADDATLLTYTSVFSNGVNRGPYAQQLVAGYPSNIITADLDVTARNAYFELCGTGRVRIRGHEWIGRKKPFRTSNI